MNQQTFTAEMFMYNLPVYSLSGSSTRHLTLKLQKDADFEVQALMFNVITDLTDFASNSYVDIMEARRYPGLEVQITDTGSGRTWFSQPTAVPNVFGNGQCPFKLPQTKVLTRNTILQFDVTNNYSGTSFGYMCFTLFGRKIYR